MARSIRYHPLFESDVVNAADWYDSRNPDLGTDSVVRVRRSVDQLVSDPERRSTAEFGIRYWPVERFPYVVFYDLTELEVLVIGVMHTSQESKNGSPVEDDSANQGVHPSRRSGVYKMEGHLAAARSALSLHPERFGMNLDHTLSQLTSLPVSERLRVVESLWNSIGADAPVAVSPEQRAEINRRVDAHERKPDELLTWDQVLDQLRDRR